MEGYTVGQRIKIIQFYCESFESIILTQRAYSSHFNVETPPSEATIVDLVAHFQQTGQVNDIPLARNEANSEETVLLAQGSIVKNSAANGKRSARRRSTRNVQGAEKNDIQLHLYKLQLVQELRPRDLQQRLIYAVRLHQIARTQNELIYHLIMSDEANFHLNGFVSKPNCIIWGTENPRVIQTGELSSTKCTAWCAITSKRIIGPFFFEDDDGNAVAVTSDRYIDMIQTVLKPALTDNANMMWFQQDGTTAHTARATMKVLRDIFGERIISRNASFNWPARSPDLTATDYFLWGYLKERVYVNKPKTIKQLKETIKAEIRGLSSEILTLVMENVIERARTCESQSGGQLSDIISQA